MRWVAGSPACSSPTPSAGGGCWSSSESISWGLSGANWSGPNIATSPSWGIWLPPTWQMIQMSMWTRVPIHVVDCSHVYLRHAATWRRLIITRVQRATCINPHGRFDMSVYTRVHMDTCVYYTWPDGRVDHLHAAMWTRVINHVAISTRVINTHVHMSHRYIWLRCY